MTTVFVDNIGVAGAGLDGWPLARAILRGETEYRPQHATNRNSDLLPPNERRRTTPTIRLALAAAQEATDVFLEARKTAASVFCSASGDLDIVDRICTALTRPEHPVSPTDFHNSVHNAPAGYWGIAARSRMPSTSLSAQDASFAGGLLEAATQVAVDKLTVLLVAYDHPAPLPLAALVPLPAAFAAALLLTPSATPRSSARLELQSVGDGDGDDDRLTLPALEILRCGNPAARCLPLLHAVAMATTRNIVLSGTGVQRLRIVCTPC